LGGSQVGQGNDLIILKAVVSPPDANQFRDGVDLLANSSSARS
jgi:hypothetical protein